MLTRHSGPAWAPLLLRHALDHARAGGCDSWLVVMPHNTAAIAAYERAGFARDGEDGWTDPEGAWHRVLQYRFVVRRTTMVVVGVPNDSGAERRALAEA